MKVDVKCFAGLTGGETCTYQEATTYELDNGNNVNDLLDRVDLPSEDVSLVLVNGKKANADTALSEGDRVGFFPAVGGM